MKDFVLKQKLCVNSQKMSYYALCEKEKRLIKNSEQEGTFLLLYQILKIEK